MADSILDSTKKILGLDSSYTPFDLDVITHINSVFAILGELGIGPSDGFMIENSIPTWDDLIVPSNQRNMIRTYMFLKVRMLFDPPTTSFLIEAMNKQIEEYEWRLREMREFALLEALGGNVVIVDGGGP